MKVYTEMYMSFKVDGIGVGKVFIFSDLVYLYCVLILSD